MAGDEIPAGQTQPSQSHGPVDPPASSPWAATAAVPHYSPPQSPPQQGVASPVVPPPSGPPSGGKTSRVPLLIGAVVLALLAGLIGGAVGASTASDDGGSSATAAGTGVLPESDTTPPSTSRPADSIAGVAEAVLPGVVTIVTQSGSGSGFFISDEGYLLTNNHVIENPGGPIAVRFNDGREERATLIGASPSYDLAVLQVDQGDSPALTLGSSESIAVGDPVVAIGSPLDLAGTVTAGIISAVDRPVTAGGRGEASYTSALQTDAAINPGNSGGPLVDMDGRVVGINSAIAALGSAFGGQSGSIGLGFAIPVDQSKIIAEEIIATGEATFPIIGASLDVQDAGPGALVAEVVPGGPADEAGIRAGDRIVRLNGQVVLSSEELIVGIRSQRPGDTVEVTYERNGQQTTVAVVTESAVG